MKAAIYARVSTFDQEPENQLRELRRYIQARGWQAIEFVDKGVSGARESRPALNELEGCEAQAARHPLRLEVGSPRTEPAALDHVPGRVDGAWRGVRQHR
jgi:predicted site-specific integrase-resolvase